MWRAGSYPVGSHPESLIEVRNDIGHGLGDADRKVWERKYNMNRINIKREIFWIVIPMQPGERGGEGRKGEKRKGITGYSTTTPKFSAIKIHFCSLRTATYVVHTGVIGGNEKASIKPHCRANGNLNFCLNFAARDQESISWINIFSESRLLVSVEVGSVWNRRRGLRRGFMCHEVFYPIRSAEDCCSW